MVAGGKDTAGLWGGHVHTALFKMENQQRHGTLLSVTCQPGWRWVGGEWIHVYEWLSPFPFHLKLVQHS